MGLGFLRVDPSKPGGQFSAVALLVLQELLNQFATGPIGQGLSYHQIVTVGTCQTRFDDMVDASQGAHGIRLRDRLFKNSADGGPHFFVIPETGKLTSPLTEEACVLRRLPNVLAQRKFKFGFTDPVNQSADDPEQFAFDFEEYSQVSGHRANGNKAFPAGVRRLVGVGKWMHIWTGLIAFLLQVRL
jgi:hypothetical protein